MAFKARVPVGHGVFKVKTEMPPHRKVEGIISALAGDGKFSAITNRNVCLLYFCKNNFVF